MDNFHIAKTFQGLETVLENELIQLGAKNTRKLSRSVSFQAELPLVYTANLKLRTALRILTPLAVDTVKNQFQLYELASSINWQRWFTEEQTFSIQSKSFKNDAFNNSTFISMKVKDAIVDQFRRLKGSRPSINNQSPDVIIDVHIFKQNCTISIDSSGESLHRRGYRNSGHRAPLNECLAAGMVLLSGWDKESPLVDPFCGTGTILCEAALMAQNIPPNIQRKRFGFENWKNFDKKLWEKVWLEAKAGTVKPKTTLKGSDISPKVIHFAKDHINNARVDNMVYLSAGHFDSKKVPEGKGFVITNPPYGERMGAADIEQLYKAFGDDLKQRYKGYNAWVISSIENFNRFIGLRPSKKINLFNGGLACQYMNFEMY